MHKDSVKNNEDVMMFYDKVMKLNEQSTTGNKTTNFTEKGKELNEEVTLLMKKRKRDTIQMGMIIPEEDDACLIEPDEDYFNLFDECYKNDVKDKDFEVNDDLRSYVYKTIYNNFTSHKSEPMSISFDDLWKAISNSDNYLVTESSSLRLILDSLKDMNKIAYSGDGNKIVAIV
jgi:hypothetical protein